MTIQIAKLPEHLKLAESDCCIIFTTANMLRRQLEDFPPETRVFTETVMSDEGFVGEPKQFLLLHRPSGLTAKRLCFFGLDETHSSQRTLLRQFFCFFDMLKRHSHNLTDVHVVLSDYLLEKLVVEHQYQRPYTVVEKTPQPHASDKIVNIITLLARSMSALEYQFPGYKTSASDTESTLLDKKKERLTLSLWLPEWCYRDDTSLGRVQYWINRENALSYGVKRAKDLAHMPANICTPDFLANEAQKLQQQFSSISVQVLNEAMLAKRDMNAYLAVNAGSCFSASMPIISYNGIPQDQCNEHKTPPLVIIGKGVTFDSGGITLKRDANMRHMIYDMTGAACVIGLMHTLAVLKVRCHVIGILATADNSIDGNAYRPGDIIQTASKQSIEVMSTDAEGRMLIADAISYSKDFSPSAIIDIATLTGAAITSLGHHCSALFCNDNQLERELLLAGERSSDEVWPFPLWREYHEAINSTHADMLNAGKNSPGAITAGCFLSNFAQNTPWAHIDIAGTGFKYGTSLSATGRPIPLLLDYIMSHAKGANC